MVTGAADRVKAAMTPNDQKSARQSAADKARGEL